jgi:hypothetical protein
MGLAYGEHDPAQPVGEVDEDMERRKLLAIAGALLFGAPIFGQPEPLAVERYERSRCENAHSWMPGH